MSIFDCPKYFIPECFLVVLFAHELIFCQYDIASELPAKPNFGIYFFRCRYQSFYDRC